ncbi:MAG: hypothetical protein ACOYMG_12915 [Candidatus Methylumidiphilus sp.]
MNSFISRIPQSFGHSLPSVMLAAVMLMTQGLASAYNSETQSPAGAIPVPAKAAVSVTVSNKPLCDLMREIKTRSGAEVKLPPNLSADVVSRSAQGETWQSVMGHLLVGYNYSAVWGKNGQPLQLTVYGRNQYAEGPAVSSAPGIQRAVSSDDLLLYETSAYALPQKYQGLNPGAVTPVSLPVERMREMPLGEKVSLTLPCGQFEVVHENRFQLENGDVTWVGYVEKAGKAFRVVITMGSQGNQGQVVTPEGAYNLDVEEGQTWLVDANASSAEEYNQGS